MTDAWRTTSRRIRVKMPDGVYEFAYNPDTKTALLPPDKYEREDILDEVMNVDVVDNCFNHVLIDCNEKR